MNKLQEWVIQLRYPYTAGVIAIMWIGSAAIAIIRPEVSGKLLISMVMVATLIISLVGFSANKR